MDAAWEKYRPCFRLEGDTGTARRIKLCPHLFPHHKSCHHPPILSLTSLRAIWVRHCDELYMKEETDADHVTDFPRAAPQRLPTVLEGGSLSPFSENSSHTQQPPCPPSGTVTPSQKVSFPWGFLPGGSQAAAASRTALGFK